MKETPELFQLGALVAGTRSPQDVPQAAWPDIIALALKHDIGPVLLWMVKQSSPDLVSEPLWTRVISAVRNNAIRYVNLEDACREVTAAFAHAEIPALWLKGIALAHTIYPQPALRSMGDLDVLVPFDLREDALKTAQTLGYHFYDTDVFVMSSQDSLRFNLAYHYPLKRKGQNATILEVHFQLLGAYETLLPLDKLAWFWTQTASPLNGSPFTIPRPEAHLLYLTAHAILQHGEEHCTLRQFYDLHRLTEHSPIDWDTIVERAQVLGWSYSVERALTLTARYFSTPIPETVFAQLKKNSVDDISARSTLRPRKTGARWEYIAIKLRHLSFAERIRLGIRLLVPPKAYMRLRYGVRSGQPVWPYYLYRWFDQGREIALTSWNRLANR